MMKTERTQRIKNHAGIVGLFLVILSLTMMSTGWTAIQIDNISDLQKIGNDPGYPLNESYELTKDIDAGETQTWSSGAGFQPVGTLSNPFTGTLDGKGHKILNLHINRSSEDYVGLLGRVSSSGRVLNLGIENSVIVGRNYVGGLVGSNEGSVDNCYYSGNVMGTSNVGGLAGNNAGTLSKSSTSDTVSGDSNIGGLSGRNAGTISQCYSTSDVSGTSVVGGLIGISATWNASLRRCYATGNVTGTSYVGGLIGRMNWGWGFETYSVGHVSGSSRVGGLVGYRFFLAFIFMSYWDKEVSGLTSSAGGTGKTTAEMKQQATYTNWAFGSVWGIVEGITYPYFIWTNPVPNLFGLTVEEAENVLTSTGFTLGVVSEQCSNTVPENLIFKQSPFPGQYLEPGSPVNVTISTGPCPANIVPDVVGLLQSIAENELMTAGYVIGVVETQCDNNVPAGYVISQDPEGGVELEPGNEVNLIVSSGPCPIVVPNVVGMTEAQADLALLNAGFFLGVVTQECSNTVPRGVIISQNPTAGAQGLPGSNVDVVVSSGPCGEGTPEGIEEGTVEGTPEGTPEGIEEGTVEGTPEGTPEGIEEGTVEGTPEGTPEGIEEGTVEGTPEGTPEGSVEGEFALVPNVVGQYFVNAVFAINSAQLVVGIITEVCTDEYPFGVIISQEPIGGSIVEMNSMVNLWVSIGPCPPEGEGTPEGIEEGVVEGIPEGVPEGVEEGIVEGTPEGVLEGAAEGIEEGIVEGTPEGVPEGTPEGVEEGVVEGTPEGVEEGEGELPGRHSADQNNDKRIDLRELLRVIQLFNSWGYHCDSTTEDGYAPGAGGDTSCAVHTTDYNPQNWRIDFYELLRLIQIFNIGGYHYCPGESEDNFCPGLN